MLHNLQMPHSLMLLAPNEHNRMSKGQACELRNLLASVCGNGLFSGFSVYGPGFRVRGLGFKVYGLGVRG